MSKPQYSVKQSKFSTGLSDLVQDNSEATAFYLKYPKNTGDFQREKQALIDLQGDDRIVRLAFADDSTQCLKLVAAPGDKLSDILKYDGVIEAEANTIACRLAGVLKYMHEFKDDGYVYYDLSSSNVFWNAAERDITVIDFGTSYRQSQIPVNYSTEVVGTPLYMAPEKLKLQPQHGKASDIFALGVLWYEMLSNSMPFDPILGNLDQQILRHDPLPLRRTSPEVAHMVSTMLSKNPEDRPSASQLVGWFSKKLPEPEF